MLKLNELLQSSREMETPFSKEKYNDSISSKNTIEKTELEILVDRKQNEVRSKALRHWALLRDSVCSAKDVSVLLDVY